MKKAILYFGGATLCLLLGYVVAVVLFKRVPAAGAPFAVAGFVLLMMGWWHFAKWVWRLLVGPKG
jgi:uncharacterized membrane protein (DUF441 family)